MEILTAALVELRADPIERYCSFDTDFTFESNVWSSTGKILQVGLVEQRVDVPNIRLRLAFDLTDSSVRAKFSQDRGPLDTLIIFIKSLNSGETWTRTGITVLGKLSSPNIANQIAQIEIETFKGDVDRGRVVLWSDEEQQRRYPGDKGFSYLRSTIHQNPSRNLKWPPGS